MEENIPNEETREEYSPRPAWQVWGARIGLVIMIIGIILWLYNIAYPTGL